MKDAKRHDGGWIEDTEEKTNALGIENSSARVLPEGTVCLSRTASVGYVVITARPMATSQDFVNWVCGTELDPRFLQYLFIAEGDDLLRFASGAVHNTIYFPEVKAFHICHPAIAEQQRIVRLLDEAFAGLATAQAHAEKNHQNARALFESELQAVFTKQGAEHGARELGEIADFKNGLNFNQSSTGETVRIVGVGDFQENHIVPTSDLASVTIDGTLASGYELREDDILTVRSNGSKDLVGRCMMVSSLEGVVSYSGFVIRIRPNPSIIDSRYLLQFMKASHTRAALTRGGGGANISNINQAKLTALSVPLPPLQTQRVVAGKLGEVHDEVRKLQAVYQRKVNALGELKKSLLHEAFSGNL